MRHRAWLRHARSTGREPLLNLDLFRYRTYAFGSLVAFIYGIALFGSTYLLPVYMQLGLQLPASHVGTILLPSLSKSFADRDEGEYSELMDWGLRLTFMLALPAAVATPMPDGPPLTSLVRSMLSAWPARALMPRAFASSMTNVASCAEASPRNRWSKWATPS